MKVLAGGSDRNEDDYSSERQVHDATAHFLCELRTTSTAVAAAAAASATAATADDDANISPQLNERARLSLGDVVATAAGRRALAAFDWLEARSSCACIGGRYMRGRWWRPPLDGEQAGVPSPKSLSVKVSSMVEGYLYEGHCMHAVCVVRVHFEREIMLTVDITLLRRICDGTA